MLSRLTVIFFIIIISCFVVPNHENSVNEYFHLNRGLGKDIYLFESKIVENGYMNLFSGGQYQIEKDWWKKTKESPSQWIDEKNYEFSHASIIKKSSYLNKIVVTIHTYIPAYGPYTKENLNEIQKKFKCSYDVLDLIVSTKKEYDKRVERGEFFSKGYFAIFETNEEMTFIFDSKGKIEKIETEIIQTKFYQETADVP